MNINVNLDATLDIVGRGVRRAAAFMGLGINAALDPEFKRIHLEDSLTNLRFFPDDLPDDLLIEIKQEFKLWIEAAGFRELCESWESFLQGLYGACLLLAASEDAKIEAGTPVPQVPRTFERLGLGDKLDAILDRFGVAPKHPEDLKSLWAARNCLGHRRGIVGESDVDGEGIFAITWLGFDTLFVDPQGNEKILPPGFEPFSAPEGGTIAMRFVQRRREFKVGDRLALSTHDLTEICWAFLREAQVAVISVSEFALAQGVPIQANVEEKQIPAL